MTNGILIGCRVWPQYTNVGDRQTIDDRQTTTDRKSMAQACPTIRSRRPKTGIRMARTVTSSIVRLQTRLSLPCWSVSATASVKIPLSEHLSTAVCRRVADVFVATGDFVSGSRTRWIFAASVEVSLRATLTATLVLTSFNQSSSVVDSTYQQYFWYSGDVCETKE